MSADMPPTGTALPPTGNRRADSTSPDDCTARATAKGTCPDQAIWLDLLGNREDPEALERRPDLQSHLDACVACKAAVDEVRRYQTMLLRARVPGLAPEQRQNLEDRVRMMAGQWVPPPRVSPKVAWGIALAAAAVLVVFVARPFLARRVEHFDDFSRRVAEATLPTLDKPGLGLLTGAVEGGVQIADRDGTWRALRTGETLRGGMRLRTAQVQGRLVVPGRFELRLAPATELEVLAMTRPEEGRGIGDGAFRLRAGEVDCTVQKLHPAQRFVVLFAGFRASVVGTRFTVQHTTSSAGVQVQVLEGAVRVDQADEWWKAPSSDTMTTVRAGSRWHYDAGRMALEPIPLPSNQASTQVNPTVQVPRAPATVRPETITPATVTPETITPAFAPAAAEVAAPPAVVETPQARGVAGRTGGRAAKGAKAMSSEDEKVHRNFLIEVPPQRMKPDEGLPNK